MAAESDLLTLAEAAEYLRVSTGHLSRLARAGRIPAADIGSGTHRHRWRFRRTDLDTWLTPPIHEAAGGGGPSAPPAPSYIIHPSRRAGVRP